MSVPFIDSFHRTYLAQDSAGAISGGEWRRLACACVLFCGLLLFVLSQLRLHAAAVPAWFVVGLLSCALGVIGGLGLKLRAAARRGDRLRQLCSFWAQSENSCLKEISVDGRLLSMSDRGMAVMEVCDFRQIRGSDWLSFWQDEWAQPAKDAFDRAVAGQLSRFSGFCPTAQGSPRWWDVVLMPVTGKAGVESVLSLSWDVTVAKSAGFALQAAHDEQAALLEDLNDGFYQLDRAWNIVKISARAEALFGHPRNSLLGTNLWTLFPDSTTAEVRSALDDVMEMGVPRHFELWLGPLNGWYRIKAFPRSSGISVFFSDITAEVMTLQRHQTSEARFRLSQELGQFADWQFDLDKREMQLSPQALQLLGLPQEAALSHQDSLVQRLHPEDRAGLVSALLDLDEGKTTLKMLVRLPDPERAEQWRHLQLTGVVLQPKTRSAGLLIGCIQDISAQKQRERDLIEAGEFTRSIIDALPLYVAVLDTSGRLVAANKAWLDYNDKTVPLWAEEGSDYLEVCRRAVQRGMPIASQLWLGLKSLLDGSGGPFRLDYELEIGGKTGYFQVTVLLMGRGTQKVLMLHEDLTERVDLQQALRSQAQRLKLAHEGSNDGLWEWQPLEQRLYVSERFVQLTGFAGGESQDVIQWMAERVHPDDSQSLAAAYDNHLQHGQPYDVELRLETADGWRWFRSRGKAEWEDGQLVRFAGSLMDVSLQRALIEQIQASETRFRDMVEHLPHVFWEFDLISQRFTYLSPALEKILGVPPRVLYQDPAAWLRLVHPEDKQLADDFRRKVLVEHQQAETEFRVQTVAGQLIWIRDRAFPFADSSGQLVRVVGIAENISEARFYQERLYAADHFEAITGLPNRTMFNKRLTFQCKQPNESERGFVVLIIAIDRLKWVQQSLGQSAHDDIIQQIARRLEQTLAGRGYLANMGGSEFAVLFSRENDAGQCESIAQGLLGALETHFKWGRESVLLAGAIGGCQFPADGDSPELLLKHASIALYAVQRAGRSGYQFFDQALMQQSIDALKLETELNRALEQQEFVLFYQPKYNLLEQRLCGAEALIRWVHPVHGLVGPLSFIPLLEESDLILPVGMWCIEQAVSQLAAWQQQGLMGFVMAVNVSLKQLHPSLVLHVRAVLERHAVDPQYLELELTESIMHESPGATSIVNELKALGVRIAVDDFGTGYSTFGSLKSFVPDTLKIEKSFLHEMVSDAADQAIVRSVIEMAHALKMVVVAEGVETAEQKHLLEQLHCDQMQGYLLSPPIEPVAFAQQFILNQSVLKARLGK